MRTIEIRKIADNIIEEIKQDGSDNLSELMTNKAKKGCE